MMPDLDRYAGTVLGAYGVTLVLLAVLVGLTLRRAREVRRRLARLEAERRDG